jgi:hypothetical protein
MDKMLFLLVRWPWIIGVVVFIALTQAPLGPWYVSAMFVLGAALVATSLARRLKLKLIEREVLHRPISMPIVASREAASHLL